MIYVFQERGKPLYKVGYTRCDAERRIKNAQPHNSDILDLVYQGDGTVVKERWLHTQLREFHYRGEWFRYEGDFVGKVAVISCEYIPVDGGVDVEHSFDALTEKEYRAILHMLEADSTERGLSTYALFRLGCTSGLRAAELAGLTYGCISEGETITATFIGKGSKLRTVQIEEKAYKACVLAFRAIHGRKPAAADPVFNSTATGRHESPGMSTATIGVRVRSIAERARAAGIIRPTLHVSPHTMRKTCEKALLISGESAPRIAEHLGVSMGALRAICEEAS